MFNVVRFIKSTKLAINAEANLRCGDFLSEKSCHHSTASFSFFLVLTTRHPLSFHKLKRKSCLFGVDNAFFNCWCYLGVLNFWFQFFSVEPCLWMFLITVSGWYYHFDVLIFIHLLNSTGVGVVALVNFCWNVFAWIKLSQIGSFHELLVLATKCLFSFDIFEIHSDVYFWVVNAFWICWRLMRVLSFWFWTLCFWNMSFLCSSLMRFFCSTNFSIFRTVCGLYSHLDLFNVVPFINSTKLAINAKTNLRFGDFLSEKSCRHSVGSLPSFWSWLADITWVFKNLKDRAAFVGLIMRFYLLMVPVSA